MVQQPSTSVDTPSDIFFYVFDRVSGDVAIEESTSSNMSIVMGISYETK